MQLSINSITPTSATTGVAVTIPSTVGNLIVVSYLGNSIGTSGIGVTSITDGQGNSYSGFGGSTAACDPEIWYAKSAITGVTAVTINFTAAGSQQVVIYDISGADPYDPVDTFSTTGVPQGPTTLALDGISGPSFNGELIITAFGSAGITGINPSPPWVLDGGGAARQSAHYSGPPSGVGGINWAWSTSTSTWGSTSVAFNPPIPTFDMSPGQCVVFEP